MAVLGASDCFAHVECSAQACHCGTVLWVGDLQFVPEALVLLCNEGGEVLGGCVRIGKIRDAGETCLLQRCLQGLWYLHVREKLSKPL